MELISISRLIPDSTGRVIDMDLNSTILKAHQIKLFSNNSNFRNGRRIHLQNHFNNDVVIILEKDTTRVAFDKLVQKKAAVGMILNESGIITDVLKISDFQELTSLIMRYVSEMEEWSQKFPVLLSHLPFTPHHPTTNQHSEKIIHETSFGKLTFFS
eukprot:TRINITY_DN3012_c0_g1_i9.p1 TRINITY_DN3012_c0_g1~~TRINITY_DN3012_c0_g1_i9.p1  ORF type:complete len:157 (+),score=33.23 TRINITY_DN3012_c0_g1_i9:681-1151(+)